MPREGYKLKILTVYVTEPQADLLRLAAEAEQRSVSNFLLKLGLDRAKELGLDSTKPKPSRAKKQA